MELPKQFPDSQYLVEVIEQPIPESNQRETTIYLNEKYNNGWKLHSIVPQIISGTVATNVFVFERIV